jgi:signal transduction histidine kinase
VSEDPGAADAEAELARRLAGIELFADLDEDQLRWVATIGRPILLQDGEVLFHDGDAAPNLYVLLEGELLMTKLFAGQEQVLSRHSVGQLEPEPPGRSTDKPSAANQFTGELPLLTGGNYVATATALGLTRVVGYDRRAFFSMLERCPQISRVLLPVLAWRIHTHEVHAGRSAMLHGLGTLASGLAHELNNPVAAAARDAVELEQVLADLTVAATRWGSLASPGEQRDLRTFLAHLDLDHSRSLPHSALAEAEVADSWADWLTVHDVDGAEEIGAAMAEHAVEIEQAEELVARLSEPARPAAVGTLALNLYARTLVLDLTEASRRIESLVTLTKTFTNMDRAPERDVDLHEGLEATLALLAPQLTTITVHRSYGELGPVPVYPSELHQVWMNLIQNAIDAMPAGGRLEIRTCEEGRCAVVEIADSGTGIAPEALAYLYQPFFTTKEVGHGTGLGLHLSRETVVNQHSGSIEVSSVPGDTRVTVRLPLDGRRR